MNGKPLNSIRNQVLLGLLLSMNVLVYADSQSQPAAQETWITVFVHGIMSVAPHLNLHNFTLLMCDDIVDTVYARTVNLMRQNPFFYTNQAMQGFGIQTIDPSDLRVGKASNAIARIYDDVTHLVAPEQTNNFYYTYGWSGLLSMSQRYQEAEGLLIAINQLVQKCRLLGITPKVRVIGYSHGGNVCLNIAAIHRDKYPDMQITIDELILLGMPVQVETDCLIASPIFKKVYHFYSSVDRIQQIDFFSFNRCFSDRIFKTRRNFKLPNKLTQVNIKINRLRSSCYNKKQRLLHAKDFNHRANISGQRRLWRDMSPGHIELWFFEWIPGKYRHNFPLAPLPTLATIPFIIAELKKHQDSFNEFPVIVDIRPQIELALIKQRKHADLCHVVPFLSHQTIDTLSSYARAVEPQERSSCVYREHISNALSDAQHKFNQQKKEMRTIGKTRRRCRRFRRRRCQAEPVDRCYHPSHEEGLVSNDEK